MTTCYLVSNFQQLYFQDFYRCLVRFYHLQLAFLSSVICAVQSIAVGVSCKHSKSMTTQYIHKNQQKREVGV